jgi:hypothetical protein
MKNPIFFCPGKEISSAGNERKKEEKNSNQSHTRPLF